MSAAARSAPPGGRLRIVVLGYVVRGPIGGMAWHHLQYVAGLHRLGHDVWFLEDSTDDAACYDPSRHVCDTDPSYGLAFARDAFDRLGLGDRWAYHDAHRGRWTGPCADAAPDIARRADVALNVSGTHPIRSWLERVPVRVLIDTDPGFEQLKLLAEPERRALADAHNRCFSFGENIGDGACPIPLASRDWLPTRQPVVLACWPVTPVPRDGRLTTVMQWNSYPPREHAGVRYGLKSDSFPAVLDLPRRVPVPLELALGGADAPRDALAARGWHIADPLAATRTPWSYRDYIQGSLGEFTVAKHGYVTGRSGWFSERSAAYMASGRAVVVEDTGFGTWLPVDGGGVLPFTTGDEAAEQIARLAREPERHARAARRLAEALFDSDAVLTSLLERALASSPVTGAQPAAAGG